MAEAKKRKTVEYGRYGYLFIAPFFIVFLIFQLYPLIYTFYRSFFYEHKFGRNASEILTGFGNYSNYVFTADSDFFKSLVVTVFLWILNFIPQILLSLLLAAWFTDAHAKLKAQGAYKVIMYMPNIITAATIAVLFNSLFGGQGPITTVLYKIHLIKHVDIISRGFWSFGIIAFIQFWMWYGNTMIVLIAGILGINPSLYEAAMVDGATSKQQFFKITLPLLKPILQFTLVTSAIGGLQMYDIPQLFNEGGPVVRIKDKNWDSTTTVVMQIKKFVSATTTQDVGRAAAYSVVLFLITLVVSMIFYIATNEKKEKR